MQLFVDYAFSYAQESESGSAPGSEDASSCTQVKGDDMEKPRQTGSLRKAAERASQSAKREAQGVPSLPLDLPVDQLLAAIETQLIPRLLVSHLDDVSADSDSPVQRESPEAGTWSSEEQVHLFALWSLEQGAGKVTEHVSALLSRGVNLDAIYLHLITPAAKHLGEQWEDDKVSFIDVQLGLTCMHQLVSECERIGFRSAGKTDGRSILLAAAPGEQHTFGVKMAADFYQRNGWLVSNLSGYKEEFILQRVAGCRYTAVGMSLHNAASLDALRKILPRIRKKSANPDLLLIVGGDFFTRNPGVGETLGADIVAVDAHKAVLDTEVFLGRLSMNNYQVPVL